MMTEKGRKNDVGPFFEVNSFVVGGDPGAGKIPALLRHPDTIGVDIDANKRHFDPLPPAPAMNGGQVIATTTTDLTH